MIKESIIAVELRKRYDEMKRKKDVATKEGQGATQQYKDLFTVFTTLRKALVVSVQKTKKYEEENQLLTEGQKMHDEQKIQLRE